MTQKDKERTAELVGRLRDAAKLHDPAAQAAIELIRLTAEECKDSLVSAVGDDMLRQQGAAQRMQRLHKELTTTPPNINKVAESPQ
jgi:hypothetical protein